MAGLLGTFGLRRMQGAVVGILYFETSFSSLVPEYRPHGVRRLLPWGSALRFGSEVVQPNG